MDQTTTRITRHIAFWVHLNFVKTCTGGEAQKAISYRHQEEPILSYQSILD